MTEPIHLRFGALPWQPATSASLIKVYDRHDRPICGLLEQGGRRYLFDCIEGQAWDLNIWAYAPVSDRDIQDLDAAEGTCFARTVDAILKAQPIVAAVAIGDKLEQALVIQPDDLRRDVYLGIMEAVVSKMETTESTAAKLRKLQLAG